MVWHNDTRGARGQLSGLAGRFRSDASRRHVGRLDGQDARASVILRMLNSLLRTLAALACYRSQFATGGAAVSTRLNAPTFRQLIESRDAQFGALAGVAFAEGVIVREPVLRPGLLK